MANNTEQPDVNCTYEDDVCIANQNPSHVCHIDSKEFRKQLRKIFKQYDHTIDLSTDRAVDMAMSLIEAEATRARIDELLNLGDSEDGGYYLKVNGGNLGERIAQLKRNLQEGRES